MLTDANQEMIDAIIKGDFTEKLEIKVRQTFIALENIFWYLKYHVLWLMGLLFFRNTLLASG